MGNENGLAGGNVSEEAGYHVPVLLHETVDALNVVSSGVYVDCTFGGGGHSRAILEKLGAKGRLIAFDQDADAAQNLPKDDRITFIPQNFRHIRRFLRAYGFDKVDGLMADLGVSSHQLNEGARGFSYRFEAALDMRMNQRQGKTAADVLNGYDARQLQAILGSYGEVTNAKTLAEAIVRQREVAVFKTIADLLNVLSPLSKGNPNRYYSQVFQALRIEVNEEFEALRELLRQLQEVVRPGGRIAIITFHSLEDRIVKQFFKLGAFEALEDPLYGRRLSSPFVLVNKKPITAGGKELAANARARSAALRVAEVISE